MKKHFCISLIFVWGLIMSALPENKTVDGEFEDAVPIAVIINNSGFTELTCTKPSIDLTAIGNGTYAWRNSAGINLGNSPNLTVTAADTYTVTVTSASGYTSDDNIIITANKGGLRAGITNHTKTTELTCTSPEIILEATGGISYSWNNGLGDDDFVIVTQPGTYTVTVTAANGCTDTKSITITTDKDVSAAITNNSKTTDLTCTVKSISLTATGGISYLWDNGLGDNANATVTSAGTYTVTVTAANGCKAVKSIKITADKSRLTAGITNNSKTTELTCTTPTISLTATGGVTYAWRNSSGDLLGSDAGLTVTADGTYTVTATSASGCDATANITITANKTPPSVSITNNSNTSVFTCATKNISLTATGGISYLWDNGLGANANATVTSAGVYSVTATAANGCTATKSITITEDGSMPTVDITNNTGSAELTCATTSISMTATGGITYAWRNSSGSNLGSNPDLTVTAAGTYTVTVTAANGCKAAKSITITTNKSVPTVLITGNTENTVLTCTSSSIILTATGGVTYLWDNGLGDNPDVTVTSAGTYTVTVTGANGCKATKSIKVTAEKNLPVAGIINNSGFTELTCAKPVISLTATGGVTYAWHNSSGDLLGSDADLTVTAAGVYTVTATSANGCNATANITITTNKTPPQAGITNNSNTSVFTCTTKSISLTATGGVTYLWDNGLGAHANATVTSAGVYSVTVTAANGCITTKSITITVDGSMPVANIINNTGSAELTCTTESISLTATGGATYAWSNSQGNNLGGNVDLVVTTAGTYTVTTTAANGCTSTKSITITTNKSAPTVQIASNTGNTLLTCTTSSIILTASGGNSYVWNNGLGEGARVTVSAAGTYTVTVKASNGCTGTASVTVTPDRSLPTVHVKDAEICLGDKTTLTASGADTYTWMPSTGLSASTGASVTASPTVTTAYAVEGVVKETGCKSIIIVTVYVEVPVVLALTATSENIELGDEITITVSTDRTGHGDFEWFINDRSYKTVSEKSITLAPSAGKQRFRVTTATTGLNCLSSSEIAINVNEDIPNAINPYNPGSGTSCCFMKSNGKREGYRVEIYNQQMQKVFEGNDGWDGTYRGRIAEPGTYFYQLYRKDGEVEKGALEVVDF
jgi:hypothetical protein